MGARAGRGAPGPKPPLSGAIGTSLEVADGAAAARAATAPAGAATATARTATARTAAAGGAPAGGSAAGRTRCARVGARGSAASGGRCGLRGRAKRRDPGGRPQIVHLGLVGGCVYLGQGSDGHRLARTSNPPKRKGSQSREECGAGDDKNCPGGWHAQVGHQVPAPDDRAAPCNGCVNTRRPAILLRERRAIVATTLSSAPAIHDLFGPIKSGVSHRLQAQQPQFLDFPWCAMPDYTQIFG